MLAVQTPLIQQICKLGNRDLLHVKHSVAMHRVSELYYHHAPLPKIFNENGISKPL